MDLEKLAQEKTEMQRHYVMVSTGIAYTCFCVNFAKNTPDRDNFELVSAIF